MWIQSIFSNLFLAHTRLNLSCMDLKMNLVSEVDEPLSFDGLIKGFSKLNIDLQNKDVSDFITMDDEKTAEYSESF